jgi:hypothetical protein
MTSYFNKVLIIISIFPPLNFPLPASSQDMTCSDIKNGVFIFFSKMDGSKATYSRSGEVQKESNSATRETVMWNVEWVNDCSYFLKYNSGLEDRPRQEIDILKKHKFLYQILSVSEDYYVFESFLDKASNPILLKDTLWIKQRRDLKNKFVTNPRIDSILAMKKTAFDSLMAKTATLYIFRPGKFAESLVNCTIYINDTPVCEMSNKAAYIIRLLKEGQTKLVGKVRNQETSVVIDFKYGKKYFLRCEIPWSLAPKPVFTKANQEEAKSYFNNIK